MNAPFYECEVAMNSKVLMARLLAIGAGSAMAQTGVPAGEYAQDDGCSATASATSILSWEPDPRHW